LFQPFCSCKVSPYIAPFVSCKKVRLLKLRTPLWTGTATCYGVESSGIESRSGEIFRTRPDRSWGPERLLYNKYMVSFSGRGRDSSVLVATGYGLDGPGIESRWGRDFPHTSRSAPGPTQPPVQWVPGLSRGTAAGAWCCHPPPSSAQVKKESYTSTSLWAFSSIAG
jgi:hypothetical protein